MENGQWIERAADSEHQSWSSWMKWLFEEMEKDIRESLIQPDIKEALLSERGLASLDCFQRWKRQMETPYADLSEREQESDRIEARKKAPVYQASLLPLLHEALDTISGLVGQQAMDDPFWEPTADKILNVIAEIGTDDDRARRYRH